MTRATDWELPGPIPHLRAALQLCLVETETHRSGTAGVTRSTRPSGSSAVASCTAPATDARSSSTPSPPRPRHAPRRRGWDPFNRLTLRNTAPFAWEVETPEGLTHHFATVKGGDPKVARLTRIADRAGHEVLLTYDPQGRLDYARDAGGRIVRFEHDARGGFARVALPHPSVEGG